MATYNGQEYITVPMEYLKVLVKQANDAGLRGQGIELAAIVWPETAAGGVMPSSAWRYYTLTGSGQRIYA